MEYLSKRLTKINNPKTLSRSISDSQSLTLNVMIRVFQFVRNSQLCHLVTKSLNRSQRFCLLVDHGHVLSPHPSDQLSEWSSSF